MGVYVRDCLHRGAAPASRRPLAHQTAEPGAGTMLEVRIPFQRLRSRQLVNQPVHGRYREVGLADNLGGRMCSTHRKGAQYRNSLTGDGAASPAVNTGHPAAPFDHIGSIRPSPG